MKFILIDDEEINLIIGEILLAQALDTPEIKTFKNAGEALRYFTCRPADCTSEVVVFLDINMPVLSGWDFLEFFNQFDDNLKSFVHIYIVSSSIDPDDKRKAFTYPNVIAYLTKPLTSTVINQYFIAADTKQL